MMTSQLSFVITKFIWLRTTASRLSLGEEQLKGCAQWGRQRSWPPCSPIHKHVHKPTLCRQAALAAKQTYSVTHARPADMLHTQACLDRLRKCELAQKPAVGLGAYADDRAGEKIQPSLFDQICADDGVEVAIVLNIVDMTVHIIVVPAGRDWLE